MEVANLGSVALDVCSITYRNIVMLCAPRHKLPFMVLLGNQEYFKICYSNNKIFLSLTGQFQ